MNQIVFVVLAAVAMLNMHVARGDGACKVEIEGKSVVLQNGDRYCSDETTSKTCSDGQFTEDKCPPGSKCLKSPGSYATLCRELRRNVDSAAPAPSPDQPAQQDQSQPKKEEQAAPAQSPKDEEKQSAPAAPTANKPETCKANINGQEQTLNTGDRYCKDDTTHVVCSYGDLIEDKCPENSKCLKKADSYQVLCRQMVTNAPWPTGPPADAPVRARRNATSDHAPEAQTAEKPETCKANINGQEQTLNTGDRYCVDSSTHRVCSYGEWVEDKCPEQSVCLKKADSWQVLCRQMVTNAPWPTGPPAGADNSVNSVRARRNAEHDEHAHPRTAPPAPEKPETCKANVEGKEQTLSTGDRYCKDDTTHVVCNYGDLIEDKCPESSKCLKSADSYRVLCRIIVRNQPWPTGPSGTENSEPQSPSEPKHSVPEHANPAPAPVAPDSPAPAPAKVPAPDSPAPAPAQPDQEDHHCAGGLKTGESICAGDNAYKQCNNGQMTEQACPPDSKCLKSETSNNVLCRQIILNKDSSLTVKSGRK